MKRCKSETTRAAGAIKCTLEAEHEGAHEGRRRTLLCTSEAGVERLLSERVLWNDPNAPEFEPLELEPDASAHPTPPLVTTPLPLEMFDHVDPARIGAPITATATELRIRWPFSVLAEAAAAPVADAEPGASVWIRQSPRRCGCGAEHSPVDPELRPGPGMPLMATLPGLSELDHRFSWARVCLQCGAVYCLVWHPEDPR